MNNSRALLIIALIFVVFIVLVAKLFDVQIIKSEELKYYAQKQQTAVEKIRAERGLIYDRNKVLLVYNRNDYSFYLDTRMVSQKGKKKIAIKFSQVFGRSPKYYLNQINGVKKTICLVKKAPSEKALLLKKFKVTGLFYREDPSRVYYYKNLASHVLGYLGTDYHGMNGIAKEYDDVLSGDDGSRVVLRDAIGDMITVAEQETKPAKPGLNIVLTINKSYQAILEDELENGLKKYEGTSAVGIIMDPNTGEVLSLANINDYDPNKYWDYSDSTRRDKAVTDTYEPGSTFKIISMSALLEENKVKPNEIVNVENGRYKFKNVYITDTHQNQYLTVKQVIEESSNIGMSKLIGKLDDETFYKYIRAFGFGNYTTIELPGEVKGSLRKPTDWSSVTKEFMSFGYGLAVTPIQMAAAYCAVVNGGILYKPELVKQEFDHNGTVVFQNNPKAVRRVISQKTSDMIKSFMVGVVEHGTGKYAQIKNMIVGGKTGTSQKLINGSYSKMNYNSSFIGFFPAENPKIVCFVLVNSPKIGRYGGSVAAPIFKDVAERIISSNPGAFKNPTEKNDQPEKTIELLNASNNGKTKAEIKDAKIISDNQRKINYSNKNIMPDLKNCSLSDAITVLSRLGIKYKIKGSGKVIGQSILPGAKINKSIKCVLSCQETVVNGTSIY